MHDSEKGQIFIYSLSAFLISFEIDCSLRIQYTNYENLPPYLCTGATGEASKGNFSNMRQITQPLPTIVSTRISVQIELCFTTVMYSDSNVDVSGLTTSSSKPLQYQAFTFRVF